MWRWQFNGGSVGVVTQTAGGQFATIPSTAFLTFRRNTVHSSGGVFVGASHESTPATADQSPPLGYHMVVEANVVSESPVCVLVNEHFTAISERGNTCPTPQTRRPSATATAMANNSPVARSTEGAVAHLR